MKDLRIYNALGMEVFKWPDSSDLTSLDISPFAEGIYVVLAAKENQGFYKKKLIVTK